MSERDERPQRRTDVGAYIAHHRERFLEELGGYLSIPSVAAEGRGIDEAAGWVAGRLRALGAEVEVLGVPNGAPVVFGQLGPADAARTLLIYNHYDVQPADPLERWDSPPFEPTVRDGKLFARGVADNKANFTSRVHAIEALRATGGALPLRVQWLVEGEEEIGSRHLPAFCEAYGARWADADGCLWEAGYKNEHGRLTLYSGLKGLASFELRARTTNTDKHSANATLLPSAAWRMTWALASLKAPDETMLIDGLMDDVVEPTPAERRYLEQIDFDDARLRANHGIEAFVTGVTGQDALLRHLYQPTCNICGVHSGYGGPGMKTVLPHEATAKLDVRLVPEMTPERVETLLRDHLARHDFDDIELIPLGGEHPVRGQVESDVVQAAIASVRAAGEEPPVVWPHMAATGPMHVVAAQFGIPSVGMGTGYHRSNGHAPNENIRLADYDEAVAVTAEFLTRFGAR